MLIQGVSESVEAAYDSPYMLLVDNVKKNRHIKMIQEEEYFTLKVLIIISRSI